MSGKKHKRTLHALVCVGLLLSVELSALGDTADSAGGGNAASKTTTIISGAVVNFADEAMKKIAQLDSATCLAPEVTGEIEGTQTQQDTLDGARRQVAAERRAELKKSESSPDTTAWGGSCDKIPPNLMEFMKKQVNAPVRPPLKAPNVERLGLYLKVMALESGGNITDTMDMQSHEVSTRANDAALIFPMPDKPGEKRWGLAQIDLTLQKAKDKGVAFNQQTNFGLWQISADQLGARANQDFIQHLVGMADGTGVDAQSPAAGPGNPAQGDSLDRLIDECGSMQFFQAKDGSSGDVGKDGATATSLRQELREHFKQLSSCVPSTGGKGIECFAKWNMSCPNANLQLALNAKPSYFATWNKAKESGGGCINALKQAVASPSAN